MTSTRSCSKSFYGSTDATTAFGQPVVGMTPTPDGHGYWLFSASGGSAALGDAPLLESDLAANSDITPIVGEATIASGVT